MSDTDEAGGAGRPDPAGERPVNADPGCGQVLNLPAVRCYWCDKPTTRRERSASGLMVPWCAACARRYRVKVEPAGGASQTSQTVAVGDQSATCRDDFRSRHRLAVAWFQRRVKPVLLNGFWKFVAVPLCTVLGAALGLTVGVILSALFVLYCVGVLGVLVGLAVWGLVRHPSGRLIVFFVTVAVSLVVLGDVREAVYIMAILVAGYGVSVLCATVAMTIGTRSG